MRTRRYTRLNEEDREAISRGLVSGKSLAAIARELGRCTCSLSREVKRNGGRRLYRAYTAEQRTFRRAGTRRRGKSKLVNNAPLRRYVETRLRRAWSPDEIAKRIRL